MKKMKKTCINININVVCINFEILKIIYVLWGWQVYISSPPFGLVEQEAYVTGDFIPPITIIQRITHIIPILLLGKLSTHAYIWSIYIWAYWELLPVARFPVDDLSLHYDTNSLLFNAHGHNIDTLMRHSFINTRPSWRPAHHNLHNLKHHENTEKTHSFLMGKTCL